MDATQSDKLPQIMVVDDDPDTVIDPGAPSAARRLRRDRGFLRRRCLQLGRENHVDVILLDLMMPEMDGFQVCRALKTDPATAEIPVIMITARDDLDARAEGMRLGVSDFLAKPVFRRQLANRIRAQLDTIATARANDATLHQLQGNSKK